jgi:DNA-binding CsgD family transcriptional regulator
MGGAAVVRIIETWVAFFITDVVYIFTQNQQLMSLPITSNLRQAFRNLCTDCREPDYERYIGLVKQALPLPGQKQVVYTIFDNLNYQIRYSSDTTTLFGYQADDPSDVGQFMAMLPPEHRDYAHLSGAWHLGLYERVPVEQKINMQGTQCGMKINRRDGTQGRLLARAHYVDLDENNNPLVSLVIAQDIAHLYKGDHYWFRASFGAQSETVFHYLSHQERTYEHDLLSEREKQVLRLLHQGLESKAIGIELGISSETVLQHRRNMLARTGARDTTALLQLAEWCQFG